MGNLETPLPSYLNEKKNIIRLIIFTSVFALVFINIYSPFGADRWFNLTRFQFFFFSSLTILTGVLVVVISRMLMFQYCKKKAIILWQYILWIFGEILMMALFYTLFEKFVLYDARLFEDIFTVSIRNTALVLLLPYSISWLWMSWNDKKDQIEKMRGLQDLPANQGNMIPFYDEKGILKFSVKKENLLYLESAENYVNICYLNQNRISKYMLRDTLKKYEVNFAGTEIVRCHRCYMVNFEKVRVIRKDKDGLKLELDNPLVPDIPVSKTYVASVMQTFSRYCKTGEGGKE